MRDKTKRESRKDAKIIANDVIMSYSEIRIQGANRAEMVRQRKRVKEIERGKEGKRFSQKRIPGD